RNSVFTSNDMKLVTPQTADVAAGSPRGFVYRSRLYKG
ncbi:MAG: hypothetical protein QOG38_1371, partial [Hyphomicrobiales bacterium]|nr:hypothetical protein [Hyphomicrobiales bacterium]